MKEGHGILMADGTTAPTLEGWREVKIGAVFHARSAESRNICKEAQGYFKNNAQRMRYGRFRRQGLFIGSGIVEAGCKHIVGARLKQSGMRWSLSGLRSILQLRLALRNGDWPLAQAA